MYTNGMPKKVSSPKVSSGYETPISWMDSFWSLTPVMEPIQPDQPRLRKVFSLGPWAW